MKSSDGALALLRAYKCYGKAAEFRSETRVVNSEICFSPALTFSCYFLKCFEIPVQHFAFVMFP